MTAKLTLGRRYWPKFNAEQRKEFQELFIKQLVNNYFSKAKKFAGQEVVFDEPVKEGSKIHVLISFKSKGDKIRIKNKFYKSQEGWKVYDMEIQDVSVVRSYGSQYAEVLRDGTPEDLLKKMREKSLDESEDEQ